MAGACVEDGDETQNEDKFFIGSIMCDFEEQFPSFFLGLWACVHLASEFYLGKCDMGERIRNTFDAKSVCETKFEVGMELERVHCCMSCMLAVSVADVDD